MATEAVTEGDTLWVPLAHRAEPLGVLKLNDPDPELQQAARAVGIALGSALVSSTRQSDMVERTRGGGRLQLAATLQRAILPNPDYEDQRLELSGRDRARFRHRRRFLRLRRGSHDPGRRVRCSGPRVPGSHPVGIGHRRLPILPDGGRNHPSRPTNRSTRPSPSRGSPMSSSPVCLCLIDTDQDGGNGGERRPHAPTSVAQRECGLPG